MLRRGRRGLIALLGAAAAGSATAGTLFVCPGDVVLFGAERPPGCRATDERSLHLGQPNVGADELADRLRAVEERVARLERLLGSSLVRRDLPPLVRPPVSDPYDSDGRLRDLGQDIDRRLDALRR